MFTVYKINTADLPQHLKSLFGRKRIARIYASETVTLSGGSWSGGSVSAYRGIGFDVPAYPTSPPQFGGGEVPTVTLEPGKMIFESGMFCGKASLKLWAHPDTIADTFPSAVQS